MNNDYADTCIRGVRKAEWIDGDIISSLVFEPDFRTCDQRDDRGYETSINWEDNDQAVSYTLRQPIAKFGALRLPRKAIDRVNEKPQSTNSLKYERKISQDNRDNPYHGNIVYLHDVPKPKIKQIAATLALEITDIFQPK